MKKNMMKKAYSQLSLAFLAAILVIGLGQAAHATPSYKEPVAPAPSNGQEAVDETDNAQTKNGGGLIVDTFVARSPAEFDFDYNRFDGLIRGNTSNSSQVQIGG